MSSPECDKALAIQSYSQKIGEFLDWLANEKRLQLGQWGKENYDQDKDWWPAGGPRTTRSTQEFEPACYSISELLAEFFEIDLNRVEQKKRAILEDLRRKRMSQTGAG